MRVLWRQHRAQLMWAAAVVVAYVALMLIVAHSAHAWLVRSHQWQAQARAEGCPVSNDFSPLNLSPACRALLPHYRAGARLSFMAAYSFALLVFQVGLPLVLVIIAVLIGAPLVAREAEHRTQLVAWTQSVTRRRWYATKTITLAVGIAVAGLIAGVANDQLQIPLSAGELASSRWSWFFSIDVAPAAEAVTAFALAVAMGAWLRRTVPAIGAALIGFLALFLITGWAVRNLTPLSQAYGPSTTPDDGWRVGYDHYHPAGQYWPLQVAYVAMLLALAAVLLAAGWRATRARASV